jgi:hypothetical protein
MDDLFANAVCQSYDSPDVSSDENIEHVLQDDVFDDDLFMDDNCDETLPAVVSSDPDDVKPSRAPQRHVVRKNVVHPPQTDVLSRAVLSKRSAPSKGPVRAAAKRKCTPGKILVLDPITVEDGGEVACVMVKKSVKKRYGDVAVPLHGQYCAVWQDVDFGGKTWIKVSSLELWIKLLVTTVTKKTTRDVSKALVDAFRQEFQASMVAARKVNNIDGPVSDDECDDGPSDDMGTRRGRTSPVVLQVKIGKFLVTTLNTKRVMVLQVDQDTAAFVSGWLLPLLFQVASGKAQIVLTPAVAPRESHGFAMGNLNRTPNIRDKVCWCPERHTWKVYIKHPKKTPCPTPFSVDPAMGALVYEKEKVEQYWLAVKDWNDCDNSKRHKISERIYQVAVSTGPGETSTDDGTQTSTEGTQSSIETDDGTQPSTENDDFAA